MRRMAPLLLDSDHRTALPGALLGRLVERIGDAGFAPALLDYCRAAVGASDCALIHHAADSADTPAPQLAATASLAGSRAREFGDWYLRGGYYRLEPSLTLARQAGSRLLLHTLCQAELPDARWQAEYQRVGLAERLSLLVGLDSGWLAINAYRPAGCAGRLDDAALALAEQAPVLAAAVRSHLAPQVPAGTLAAGTDIGTGADDDPRLAALSERERQVMRAILAGSSAKQAARDLGLSPTSIATYRQRAFDKLGIRRQVELFQLLRRPAG